MTLLERYIFRRALLYTFGSLLSLVTIVWIVQALSRIDIVKTSVSTVGNIFWIAFMLLPDLASGVVPFAVVIGCVQALNALNAGSERAVIAASGAKRTVIVKPILILGLLAAALVFLVSHVIGPASSREFQNGMRTINADALTLFLQPGRFEEVQDGLVVSIADARGTEITGLFIADTRDEATELTYFASRGNVVEEGARSYLLLSNGQLHRRDTANGAVSVIQFGTYAFDLADLRPSNNNDWTRTSERSTADLWDPHPNDKKAQDEPEELTEELVQRFSDFLYPIAFALWALVVAARPRTNRSGPGPAMAFGLGGALVLKALGFVSLSLVDRDQGFAFLPILLPVSAIVLNAWMVRRDVDLMESGPVRALVDAFSNLGERIAALMPTGSAYSGGRGA